MFIVICPIAGTKCGLMRIMSKMRMRRGWWDNTVLIYWRQRRSWCSWWIPVSICEVGDVLHCCRRSHTEANDAWILRGIKSEVSPVTGLTSLCRRTNRELKVWRYASHQPYFPGVAISSTEIMNGGIDSKPGSFAGWVTGQKSHCRKYSGAQIGKASCLGWRLGGQKWDHFWFKLTLQAHGDDAMDQRRWSILGSVATSSIYVAAMESPVDCRLKGAPCWIEHCALPLGCIELNPCCSEGNP